MMALLVSHPDAWIMMDATSDPVENRKLSPDGISNILLGEKKCTTNEPRSHANYSFDASPREL